MPYTDNGTGYQNTDTSRSAAVSGEGRKLTLRDQVHDVLRRSIVPLTTQDIAEILHRPYASVQPRLSELQDEGHVEDSGERGLTEYGRPCIKWRATS